MNDKTEDQTITLNLKLREAQAIISASTTFYEEQVKPLKEKNQLSSFWILLYKDYVNGIKKVGKQYDTQIGIIINEEK
jgi:hypothetical protein